MLGCQVNSLMPRENTPPARTVAVPTSHGTIKWYNAEKGYGFIEISGEPDIFIHVKELRKCGILALVDGSPVSFKAELGKKGLFATEIKVLPTK